MGVEHRRPIASYRMAANRPNEPLEARLRHSAARSRSLPPPQPSPVDLLLVHSSDLHVDDEQNATKHSDGTAGLAAVLAAARAAGADIVLLAGDTFDNNRVPAAVLDRTGRLLADAGLPVVI